MNKFLQQLKYQFNAGGMYIKLLFINTAIFFLFGIFVIVFKLMLWNPTALIDFKDFFSLYSKPIEFITHPWGIFTYMFMHHDFWHLFGNMLILFFIGRLFEENLGSKRMLSTYIIGGVFGGIIHLMATNIFPLLVMNGYPITLGASASVMAIFSAIGFYTPNREIHLFGIFRVRLIVLTVVYLLLDFARLSNLDNVAHFAHLGGALWGFIFVRNLKKGKDLSLWFDRLVSKLAAFKIKKRIKIVNSKKKKKSKFKTYKNENPPKDDYSYNENKKLRQEKVDQILDKIKDSGYESLTKAEKDFLFDASKNI